jgi:hypothetical protein
VFKVLGQSQHLQNTHDNHRNGGNIRELHRLQLVGNNQWIANKQIMVAVHLLLLLFMGALATVRRAQRNSFVKLDGNPGSLLGIFPHEEQGVTTLRDSVEEVAVSSLEFLTRSLIPFSLCFSRATSNEWYLSCRAILSNGASLNLNCWSPMLISTWLVFRSITFGLFPHIIA